MYCRGDGLVGQDYAKALEWFDKAIKSAGKDPRKYTTAAKACRNAGLLNKHHLVSTASPSEAITYFQRCVDFGEQQADDDSDDDSENLDVQESREDLAEILRKDPQLAPLTGCSVVVHGLNNKSYNGMAGELFRRSFQTKF